MKIIVLIFMLLCGSVVLYAEVKIPAIFSNHAVLARSSKVPVFGKADPGEKITVSINGQNKTAVTDNMGNWRVELDLLNSPEGPFDLKINDKIIRDVLIGEVWLCSGQSNMHFEMGKEMHFERERQLPANRHFRYFKVRLSPHAQVQWNLSGNWVVMNPVQMRYVSAVGYYFGKTLYKELNTPVGLIQSSLGGTPIQVWMSKDTLQSFPDINQKAMNEIESAKSYPERFAKFMVENSDWEKRNNRADQEPQLPRAETVWEKLSIDKLHDGIFWCKIAFSLTEKEAKKGFNIFLDRIFAPATVWIDGKCIGTHTPQQGWRYDYFRKKIAGGQFTPGKHELMVRIVNSQEKLQGGFRNNNPKIASCLLEFDDWKYCAEKLFSKLSKEEELARPKQPGFPPREHYLPTYLYNGMIAPLKSLRLSGIIWYQGENNATDPAGYAKMFPAMITAWRNDFENKKLPFYFCQIAAYLPKKNNPADTGILPIIRQSQMKALMLPKTGYVVLIDAGESLDIHPRDKQTPGERLAAVALADTYGKKLPFKGPEFNKAECQADKVIVTFNHNGGGLKAIELPTTYIVKSVTNKSMPLVRNSPNAQVEGFAISGKDGKWYWADQAEIKDNMVIVSSEKVKNPVKIRFAFQNNPTFNLYNQAGFPAVPFEETLTATTKKVH